MLTRRGTNERSAAALLLVVLGATASAGCGSILGYEDAYETAVAGGAAGSAGSAANAGSSGSAGSVGGAAGKAGAAGVSSGGAAGASGQAPGGAAGAPSGGAAGAAGASGQAGLGGGAGSAGAIGGNAGESGQGGAGQAGSAGTSGTAGAAGEAGGGGTAGSGGGACPILFVAPSPGSGGAGGSAGADPSADGCVKEKPLTDISVAFGKATSAIGLQEIRLCGAAHTAKGGLSLPPNVSLRGGYDCANWQISGIPEDVVPSEITFAGEKPSTLLRVPPGSSGSITVEHVSLLAGPKVGEEPRNVPAIGLDLAGGMPIVRYVRIEPPSAKVTDTSKPFASAGIIVRSMVQATVEHATITQTKGELSTVSDRSSAGLGVGVDKNAQLIINDSTVVSTDNRSDGIGTSSLALSVQSGATVNVQGGSYRASLGYSIDVKSSIVTGGALVSGGGTLILRNALVAGESGSAGADDGTPSRANVVGVGGDLFSTLVIDASRIIADGGQGTGSSIALGSLGATVTATSTIFFGGSSGTAAATAGVLGGGKLSFDHCTMVGGRPIAGKQATAIQVSEPLSSSLVLRNSLLMGESDIFAGLALSGGCKIAGGEMSNTAIVLVGPTQLIGGGLLGNGSPCPEGIYGCLSDLEAVFPVNGLTKANQVYSVPGVPVCGATTGSNGAPSCSSPNACLASMFPDYSAADAGKASAYAGKGFMPRICALVRGGETSAVKTDVDGAPRAATRPTMGAIQATFTYLAVCL